MEPKQLAAAYDRVAAAYAARFGDELAHKPLGRALLDAFAELVGAGLVLEVGSGPGQGAAWLYNRGVKVEGLDLSPAMVAVARERYPDIPFRVGDLLAIDAPDGSLSGLLALYAIVHLDAEGVDRAAVEWTRVLAPGGWGLVSFHVGVEIVPLDEFLGERVSIVFRFHERARVERSLAEAGFVFEAVLERQGDAAVEAPTRRAYLLARKRS